VSTDVAAGTAGVRTDEDGAGGAGGKGAARRGPLRRVVDRLSTGVVAIVLLVIGVLWLVPTIGLAISSLREPSDINSTGWWTVLTEPAQLTVDNYRALLENDRMVSAFWNTVLITVPTTLLVVLIAAFAAYAFAWIDFPGRDWLFLIVIALLVVPIQVALIPVARLYGDIGIYGDVLGVILFHVAFGLPFAIFLLRNFFAGIPRDLLEAARMDGAGEFTVFFRVVLPLGLPAIASLAIFQFLWVWNDLLVALVFARPDSAPLTIAIREQTRQFGSNLDVIAPGAFLSMIVPLLVFFAFQRYFVQGVLAGSVK
jgi:alpha-glucoside transport system permease protein